MYDKELVNKKLYELYIIANQKINWLDHDNGGYIITDNDFDKLNNKLKEIKVLFGEQTLEEKLASNYYSDNKKHIEFLDDVEKYFNIQNNPKRDKVHELAWERGHSAGYYEVFNCYHDLVELIK